MYQRRLRKPVSRAVPAAAQKVVFWPDYGKKYFGRPVFFSGKKELNNGAPSRIQKEDYISVYTMETVAMVI